MRCIRRFETLSEDQLILDLTRTPPSSTVVKHWIEEVVKRFPRLAPACLTIDNLISEKIDDMSNNWIVDTGATSRKTGNPVLLYNIRTVPPIIIKTAKGIVIVTKTGTACVKGDQGNIFLLINVHLNDNPETPNLLSMSIALKAASNDNPETPTLLSMSIALKAASNDNPEASTLLSMSIAL
eukprot:gene9437-4071_t